MKIHAGYEISYDCPQPTPMILALSVHPNRRSGLITPDRMLIYPRCPSRNIATGSAMLATCSMLLPA